MINLLKIFQNLDDVISYLFSNKCNERKFLINFLNNLDRIKKINRQQLPKNKKVERVIIIIDKKLFSKNKTPRDANIIQNGKIITVEIGLAELCETLPPE